MKYPTQAFTGGQLVTINEGNKFFGQDASGDVAMIKYSTWDRAGYKTNKQPPKYAIALKDGNGAFEFAWVDEDQMTLMETQPTKRPTWTKRVAGVVTYSPFAAN